MILSLIVSLIFTFIVVINSASQICFVVIRLPNTRGRQNTINLIALHEYGNAEKH